MDYEMGYYLPVAEDKVAEWNDYRNKLLEYRQALKALGDSIGAEKVCTGFAGSLCGAVFKAVDGVERVHPAFSKQTNRHGAHPVLSRGRSDEQKAAIKEFEVRNEAVAAMKPDPEGVAKRHGFITGYEYKTTNGSGSTSIGNPFNPVQAAWFDPEGVILVYAPDANKAIQSFKESHAKDVEKHPEFCYPLVSVTPDYWVTPEGYERITEARWNAMKWKYLDEKGTGE